MAGAKWSDDTKFTEGGECQIGDKIMGLRSGANFKFDFPSDGIKDGNGNYLIKWATTGAAADNFLQFTNGEAGTPLKIEADGADANVSIDLDLKGTGVLDVNGLFTINGTVSLNAIIDDDTMATATATNVPTAESVVAYIAATPGGAGGSNTELQYNNAGVLDGISSLTYNGTNVTSTRGAIIDGSSDEIQLKVQGNATQTSNVFEVEDSAASNLLTVDNSGNVDIALAIRHVGDVNNQVVFGTDTQDYQTGGSSRLDLSDSGVRMGGANSRVTTILDEDDMVSDSATALATQQSIKAYVDNTAGAAGGSNTQIQYNNAGTLDGDSGFTTDGAGAINIVGDLDVDNLNLNGNTIISTDAAGDINLTPDTTGDLVLDGLKWPQADGNANQHLKTDGVAQIGFTTATYADTYGASELLYSNGANTVEGLTTANSAMLFTNSSGVPAWSASMADGEVMIGSAGGSPAPSTLTPGTGISIANAGGSITISATGGGFAVATISGTSQAGAVNTMYIALNAGQTTLTLPGTFSVGDTISLVGSTANTGGWIIQTAAGDTVIYNGTATSGGGTITSSALAGQTIELVADVADTSWVVVDTVNTTLTTA